MMAPEETPDLVAELGKLGALDDAESTRLLGMIMALAGEVFVLKAQVERLTRALEAGGAVDAQRMAAVAGSEGMKNWLATEEADFARGLTAPFLRDGAAVNSTRWMREK